MLAPVIDLGVDDERPPFSYVLVEGRAEVLGRKNISD